MVSKKCYIYFFKYSLLHYINQCLVVVFLFVEFLKTSSGGKWTLTDIADFTQLGSPARLVTKRRMIQYSSSQGNMDDTVRRLEQQLQEYQIRENQLRIENYRLQRRAEEQQRQAEARAEALQKQVVDSNIKVQDSNRRAEYSQRTAAELLVESNKRAERAEERVQHVERFLAETRRSLRQSEQRYQISSTHWAVRREEVELTGLELGVGGWATVIVAKFRGAQVAVKRIHNQIISRHNIQLFQREMNIAARLRHPNLIQFIGATIKGEMMIIMELMATSLRSQLETEEYLQPKL